MHCSIGWKNQNTHCYLSYLCFTSVSFKQFNTYDLNRHSIGVSQLFGLKFFFFVNMISPQHERDLLDKQIDNLPLLTLKFIRLKQRHFWSDKRKEKLKSIMKPFFGRPLWCQNISSNCHFLETKFGYDERIGTKQATGAVFTFHFLRNLRIVPTS